MRIVSGLKRDDHSVKVSVIVDADMYEAFKTAEAIAGPDYYLQAKLHRLPGASQHGRDK